MPVIQPLSHNLTVWRQRRAMSVSDLARASGVSKSTLSEVERGRGNPSIETVEALAAALSVPFATLFEAHDPVEDFTVVRSDTAPEVSRTETWSATLLCQLPSSGDIEMYRLALAVGSQRTVDTHNFGVSEIVLVTSGELEIITQRRRERLGEFDAAYFGANIQRTYLAPSQDVELILLNQYADSERIVTMRTQRRARGRY